MAGARSRQWVTGAAAVPFAVSVQDKFHYTADLRSPTMHKWLCACRGDNGLHLHMWRSQASGVTKIIIIIIKQPSRDVPLLNTNLPAPQQTEGRGRSRARVATTCR